MTTDEMWFEEKLQKMKDELIGVIEKTEKTNREYIDLKEVALRKDLTATDLIAKAAHTRLDSGQKNKRAIYVLIIGALIAQYIPALIKILGSLPK